MPKEIGWSNESYLLYQIKSLLARAGSTITGGITSLNGLTDATQTFAVGTAGAGFSISSAGGVHTFNIPNASASAKGLLTAVDWSTFNSKMGGTLTTNYLPKATGATMLGNSQIFDNGTSVSIGTAGSGTNTVNILAGASGITSSLVINSVAAASDISLQVGGVGYALVRGGSSFTTIGSQQATPLDLITSNASRLRITATGDVGIGTTTPSAKLQVVGSTVRFSADTSTSGLLEFITGNGFARIQTNFWGGSQVPLQFTNSSGSEWMRITPGGNVLIGTTTDAGYRLDVNGGLFRTVNGTAQVRHILGFASATPGISVLNYATNGKAAALLAGTGGCAFLFDDSGSFNIVSEPRTNFDNNSVGNGTLQLSIDSNGNIGVRQSTFGSSATRTFAISNGTAPSTSPADAFQMYSNDIVAGNAAPHFRTENGAVVKVYQETTGVGAATRVGGGGTNVTDTDTFDGYTIAQVVKALRNQGLLA